MNPSLAKIIGDFAAGSSILLSGLAGTGKTVFIIDHLKHLLEDDKRCILVVVEKGYPRLYKEALSLGLEIEEYVSRNLAIIDYLPQVKEPYDRETLVSGTLTDLSIEIGRQFVDSRAVIIDSLTPLTFYNDHNTILKTLLTFNKRIEGKNCVGMVSITQEAVDTKMYHAIEGIFDYILKFVIDSEYRRILKVVKSLGAALPLSPIIMDISKSHVSYRIMFPTECFDEYQF